MTVSLFVPEMYNHSHRNWKVGHSDLPLVDTLGTQDASLTKFDDFKPKSKPSPPVKYSYKISKVGHGDLLFSCHTPGT